MIATSLPMVVLVNVETSILIKLPSSSRNSQDVAINCIISSNKQTLVVQYERNHFEIFELMNDNQVRLHDWSKSNELPAHFLKQYNQMCRIQEIETSSKFLLSSNYTWSVLDIEKPLVADHMLEKSLAWNNLDSKIGLGWTSYLKTSQSRFIDNQSTDVSQDSNDTNQVDNLTINKNKNALFISYFFTIQRNLSSKSLDQHS